MAALSRVLLVGTSHRKPTDIMAISNPRAWHFNYNSIVKDADSDTIAEPLVAPARATPAPSEATAVLGSAPSRVSAPIAAVHLDVNPAERRSAKLAVPPPVAGPPSASIPAVAVTVAPPSSGSPPSASIHLSASYAPSGSIVSPEQGMQMFAARRAWTFAVALSALCFGAIGLIALLGGDPVGQRVHMVGIGVTALVGAGYAIRYRSRTEFHPNALLVLVYTSMIANASGFVYWGVFSGYLGLVTVSGYAFASGAPRRHVVQATAVAVGLHFGIGATQLLGYFPAHALLVPSGSFGLPAQWIVLFLLEFILVGAILAGLDAQAKMRTILDEHDLALRDLARREAQLAEAHEAVRDARGGDEGRFSGETLGGRFKLGAVIGRGAMGEVYAATDGNSASPCAVKVLASHLLADESAVQRFVREARIVASLESPNIIKLIDVSERGAATPFIAMERLAGEDLGTLLKHKPEWDGAEVAVVMQAIANGLAIAHAAGVVHRDLKPGNLFAATFENQTIWKVLDFGVAKASGSEATMTAGHVVGTPGYMAPEQARGEPVDLRADVYSLAVIAYRMLTGRPVVVPGDLPAMIHEVVYRMPPAPSKVASVSSQIEAVLMVGLAKSPHQRFDSAVAFANAFAAAQAGNVSHDILARAASLKARTPWGEWVRRPLDRKRTATDER